MLSTTVLARNFLAHARVLAASLAEHDPGARLVAVVVDARPGELSGEPFEVRTPGELGVPDAELHRRATMYRPQELISSLKAAVLAALLDRGDPIVLLDADMLALAPLGDLGELAAAHGVVLTPHSHVPLPYAPGGLGPEQAILRSGVFNGGLLAVGPGARPFLEWWAERSARDCVSDPDRALVLSQTWLSLVPALFDHHVLTDRGVNLTGHGLGDDDLRWEDGRPWIGERPVRAYHFAGRFDPHRPDPFGEYASALPGWPRLDERPGLARLCREYAERLLAAGYDAARATPWGLATAPSLDHAGREAYRLAVIAAERDATPEPPNPFADGADALHRWLDGPAPAAPGVSRRLLALHGLRPDLQAAFPAVPGEDEPRLAGWAASS